MSPGSKNRSKAKIWLTFFIILTMVITAAVWSFQSYKQLTASINQLSAPDDKSALIQNTMQGITKAENYIQAYILTNEPNVYDAYKEEIKRVQLSIDELKEQMAEDSLQIQRVDSLEILFLQKLNYLSDFLRAKQIEQTRNFSNQALEKIEKSTADSAQTESKLIAKLKTTQETKPKIEENLVEREFKAPGLWEGIKRIFGAKNIRVDTVLRVENDTIRTTEVIIDTLTMTSYNPDTMLLRVKQILQEVANQELRSQYILSSKELNLLRQDMRLRSEIDEILSQLKQYEESSFQEGRSESYRVTRNSTAAILTLGVLGIGLGGFFLFAIGRDLTRSYYLSQRLELEKNKANHLAKVKEEFLANMSHEIRTPLNSILGFSDLMRKTELNPKQQTYSTALSENTQYLIGLVNDILDFSKLESDKLDLHIEPLYFPDLLKEIENLFHLQCQEKNLELRIHYSPELKSIDVLGDAFRIKQILTNLIGNSVKFTQSGYIEINVKAQKKMDRYELKIKVKDTGKGIDPSKFKRIFNSFEQEDASVTKEYGGTGLGLAIVKKLMDEMKGKITVDSQPNQQTTFTLRLALPFLPHPPEVSAPNALIKRKVYFEAHALIIEDDHWNATLLKTILKPHFKTVWGFENSIEAKEFLEKNHPQIDLVMTDINMPQFSGMDILGLIKSLDPTIPVMAITAHASPQKVEEFLAKGFASVITKPYEEMAIIETLANAMKHKFRAKEEGIKAEKMTFDFERIKQFTGDDDELLNDLIQELISNNGQNLAQFKQQLFGENKVLLANMAHKMVQTYDSLNLTPIAEALKSIEVYHQLNKHEEMLSVAHDLLPILEEVNAELQQIMPQSYT